MPLPDHVMLRNHTSGGPKSVRCLHKIFSGHNFHANFCCGKQFLFSVHFLLQTDPFGTKFSKAAFDANYNTKLVTEFIALVNQMIIYFAIYPSKYSDCAKSTNRRRCPATTTTTTTKGQGIAAGACLLAANAQSGAKCVILNDCSPLFHMPVMNATIVYIPNCK